MTTRASFSLTRSEMPWLVMPIGESLTTVWKRCREAVPGEKLFDIAEGYVSSILDGLLQFHNADRGSVGQLPLCRLRI